MDGRSGLILSACSGNRSSLTHFRRRANAQNVSFRISLQWPIRGIINLVDNTKLYCNTPTDAAPQFLWKLTPLTAVVHLLKQNFKGAGFL